MSHTYTGDWTYFVGGGVATFDCDADGDSDLFVAGGADPSALFRNETSGLLAFEPVISPTVQIDAVTGAYPLDIDADGVMDIVVLRAGENLLLHGLGGIARSGSPTPNSASTAATVGQRRSAPPGRTIIGFPRSPSGTTWIATTPTVRSMPASIAVQWPDGYCARKALERRMT